MIMEIKVIKYDELKNRRIVNYIHCKRKDLRKRKDGFYVKYKENMYPVYKDYMFGLIIEINKSTDISEITETIYIK